MKKSSEYQRRRFRSECREHPEIWELLVDELRELLYEDAMVSRMMLLSRRGIPAVAALDTDAEPIWEILRRARIAGLENAVKQKIGKLIREILESDKVGLKWTGSASYNSWIFSSGAKYRHPDWRPLYVHRKRDSDADEFCISRRKRLTDLNYSPDRPSSWIFYRRCMLQHELKYILDAQSLKDFEWDDHAVLTWSTLCRRVHSDGYVTLWRKLDRT